MSVKKMRLTYVVILAEPTTSHHEATSYRNKYCIIIMPFGPPSPANIALSRRSASWKPSQMRTVRF
jgi:hypothetical protein